MNWTKKTVTMLFIMFVAVTTVAYASHKNLLTIPTSGNVPVAELSSLPVSIEWGNVTSSEPVLKSLSLTNTGETTVSSLNLTYTLPPAFVGVLSWDLEGQTLVVGETKIGTLNLTLTSMPDGPFNFDIDIAGVA